MKSNRIDNFQYIRTIIENNNIKETQENKIKTNISLGSDDNYEERGFLNEQKRQVKLSYIEMLWSKSPYRRRYQLHQRNFCSGSNS
tara:strand:- start:274 stop:531 length:258 start_codon:yes stop_codon:yes gene_type:complete